MFNCTGLVTQTQVGANRPLEKKMLNVTAWVSGRTARLWRTAPLGLAAAMLTLPATAQAPGLAMLDRLEAGQWQLTTRDGSGPPRSYCLGDPRQLLQIQHDGARCSRFTVTDEARTVVVSYDCGGAGSGHTTVRMETNRLVQVETQGILRGSPFSLAYEGRRTGTCTR